MARSIWKGYISFGLVNIPVELHRAERRSDMHFELVDSRDRSKVRYQRVNETTGEEVPWGSVVKAYEYSDDNYVLMKDEDFKKVAVKATKTIEIEDFVNRADIDVVYYDRPYYLIPGSKGEKGYVLLREALKHTDCVGIAKVVIRTREYLCGVMARDEALVLMLLRFRQELVDKKEFNFPSESLQSYKISPKEVKLAEQLVETMTSLWKPDRYIDDYRQALLKWIETKAEKGQTATVATAEEEEEPEPVIFNMMDVLKKSVQQKSSRKSPARRPAAKKRPAKRKRA